MGRRMGVRGSIQWADPEGIVHVGKSQIADHQSSFINRKGFTLIELLVVISIVALLMAILMPCLQRVRRQAKAVGCQANLRQSGMYFAAYVAENDGKFISFRTGLDLWKVHLVAAGLSSQRKSVRLCPIASKTESLAAATGDVWEKAGTEFEPGETFGAWSYICRQPDGNVNLILGSYAFNIAVANFAFSGWGGVGKYVYGEGSPTDKIETASQVPAYLDSVGMLLTVDNLHDAPPPYEGFWIGGSTVAFSTSLIDRHDGGVNCLFADWSVRKVGLKELWTLKWDRYWDMAGPWTKRGGVKAEDWPEWMRKFRDY